uniref:Uncharacterized protein n=1 Tax=Prymnesium polylepis TaxID=72548 RepID=A0A7S4JTQ9_9EUKA
MNRSSNAQGAPQLWDDVVHERVLSGRTAETHREVQLATVDMHLLSLCDVFVGKFTSNFFRTAYAVHAARCDCAAPFVSLDAPWCSDYGMRAGSNYRFPVRDSSTEIPNDNKFWC